MTTKPRRNRDTHEDDQLVEQEPWAEDQDRSVTPAPTPLVVDNPPYVVPMGVADAPPAVPPEPVQDPEVQAYLDAHVAPPDPRDPDAPPMTAEEYQDGFSKPPDPRDTGSEDASPGDLNPAVPDPLPPAPVNVDVPFVSQDADTLNCTMGNWDGEPGAYGYVWSRDGVGIEQDTATITLVQDDVGHDYSCQVLAQNAGGVGTAPNSNVVTIAAFARAARREGV